MVCVTVCLPTLSTHPLINVMKLENEGAVKHGAKACKSPAKLATMGASDMIAPA
jgi:hypothetical protein